MSTDGSLSEVGLNDFFHLSLHPKFSYINAPCFLHFSSFFLFFPSLSLNFLEDYPNDVFLIDGIPLEQSSCTIQSIQYIYSVGMISIFSNLVFLIKTKASIIRFDIFFHAFCKSFRKRHEWFFKACDIMICNNKMLHLKTIYIYILLWYLY